MEVILEFRLKGIDVLFVLRLLDNQIISKPVLLFPELANLEVGFFIHPNQLHVHVAELVLLLLAVLLEFPDFKLVLLVIPKVVSLQVLDLEMVLVFEIADLHVLDMLDLRDLLLQLLYLVNQLPVLQLA